MVVGLNHRTAPLAMRERFWIGENSRYAAMRELKNAEGIEEAIVLSTRCRTEFLLWASEPTLAANTLTQFLNTECGLKLTEWEHFYRLLGDAALTHVFRVASGLDSVALGEPQIAAQLEAAWTEARSLGTSGRFLDSVLKKSIQVSRRVHRESAIDEMMISIPAAAVELARQIYGTLAGKNVLLVGAKTTELLARYLLENGAILSVLDQNADRARELTERVGGTPASLADRWQHMLRADVVISCSGSPHVILTRAEAERIAIERNRVALLIIDVAMPRDVDPEVRRVDGILLCDLDGLERVASQSVMRNATAAAQAEQIVVAEAAGVLNTLVAESAVPASQALRHKLEEICRQELESFTQERGPFTREQDQALHAITAKIIEKIASSLVRELKETPEKAERERMNTAVERLFHLETPKQALAGTISDTEEAEPGRIRAGATGP
jgi:glutamyl-tRNA reductase